MALSRQWHSRFNIGVSDFSTAALLAKSVLWGMKALLKGEVSTGTVGAEGAAPVGSRWTCAGSSDSATAGMDATDRWGATFDASKIVRASGAVAHSWIVLQSPAAIGPYYVLITYNGGSDTAASITMSKTAFTGGGIDADPSTPTSWTVLNASSFCENVAVAYSLHYTVDADGNFFFLTSKNSSTIFNTAFFAQTLIETRSNDTHKLFSVWGHSTGGRGPGLVTGGAVQGRTALNSALATGGGAQWTFGSGPSAMPGVLPANAGDSKFDTLPWYVMTTNAGAAGIRGRFPDAVAIGLATVGASEPNTTAQERCVVSDALIPSSVVPVL